MFDYWLYYLYLSIWQVFNTARVVLEYDRFLYYYTSAYPSIIRFLYISIRPYLLPDDSYIYVDGIHLLLAARTKGVLLDFRYEETSEFTYPP